MQGCLKEKMLFAYKYTYIYEIFWFLDGLMRKKILKNVIVVLQTQVGVVRWVCGSGHYVHV